MKIVLVLALAILLIGSGYAYQLTEQNRLKEQQVSDYQVQVEQLLSEVEANGRARLQYQWQIDELPGRVEADRSDRDRALLALVAEYGPREAAAMARTGSPRLRFLKYDWTLNDISGS